MNNVKRNSPTAKTPRAPLEQRSEQGPEQGFALYMAIGFIVLITVLAGSVGNTLNTAIIAELRQSDSRELLYEAETALSEGWDYVFTQDGIDANWLSSAVSDTSATGLEDRTNCLSSRVTSVSDYFIASQVTSSDIRRRYFVRKDGDDYFIFGCAFEGSNRRAAMVEMDSSGGFTRTRQRRY